MTEEQDESPTGAPTRPKHRRVRTAPVPGSDPEPQAEVAVGAAEDDERRWGDAPAGNDQQLRQDVPPHY